MTGRLFLTALILFGFAGNCYSAVIESGVIKEQIKKDLLQKISSEIPGKVEIKINRLPFRSVNIPDDKDIKINTDINLRHFSSSKFVRVKISADNKSVKTFGVPVKIRVRDRVRVARNHIDSGKILKRADFAFEERDITFDFKNVTRKNYTVIGKITKKNFKPGDIIDKRFLRTRPVILKNTPIYLIFKSKNSRISVSVPGEAKQDGNVGDYIRVLNKKYKKFYVGQITGRNTVLIDL